MRACFNVSVGRRRQHEKSNSQHSQNALFGSPRIATCTFQATGRLSDPMETHWKICVALTDLFEIDLPYKGSKAKSKLSLFRILRILMSLRSPRSLRSLGSCGSLKSWRSLEHVGSLRSLKSLESLRSFGSLTESVKFDASDVLQRLMEPCRLQRFEKPGKFAKFETLGTWGAFQTLGRLESLGSLSSVGSLRVWGI